MDAIWKKKHFYQNFVKIKHLGHFSGKIKHIKQEGPK